MDIDGDAIAISIGATATVLYATKAKTIPHFVFAVTVGGLTYVGAKASIEKPRRFIGAVLDGIVGVCIGSVVAAIAKVAST